MHKPMFQDFGATEGEDRNTTSDTTHIGSNSSVIFSLPANQSPIQAWEMREDIQLNHPHVDLTDAWSSDGDSVSSSTVSSDSSEWHEDESGPHNADGSSRAALCSNSHGRSRRLLKRAQVYTDEEVVDQAIDRWKAYSRHCHQGLELLRQQLLDSYVPFAVESYQGTTERQKRAFLHSWCSSKSRVKSTLPALASSSSSSPITNNSATRLASWRRRRAMKRMLHHSVKVANQRHLACLSKFALISNRLAPWRRTSTSAAAQLSFGTCSSSGFPSTSGTSGPFPTGCSNPGNTTALGLAGVPCSSSFLLPQRCRFRDPTTTTWWESQCVNSCLPCLSVCAFHLVYYHLTPTPSRAAGEDDDASSSWGGTSDAAAVAMEKQSPCGNVSPEEDSLTGSLPSRSQSPMPSAPECCTAGKANSSLLRTTDCFSLPTGLAVAESGLRNMKPAADKKVSQLRQATGSCYGSGSAHFSSSPFSLQLPKQHLFRRCGGGTDGACSEPVIAWTPASRCILHSTSQSAVTTFSGESLGPSCGREGGTQSSSPSISSLIIKAFHQDP